MRTLNELIEELPARVSDAIKGLVPSADARITELTGQLTTAQANLSTAQERITTLETGAGEAAALLKAKDAELTQLKADLAAKDAEIAKLQGEAQTVDQAADVKARELAAAQGIPAGQLPDAASTGGATVQQQVDALRAKLATASADQKFQISQQIQALLEKPRS